jgi:outer membrane protein TolC
MLKRPILLCAAGLLCLSIEAAAAGAQALPNSSRSAEAAPHAASPTSTEDSSQLSPNQQTPALPTASAASQATLPATAPLVTNPAPAPLADGVPAPSALPPAPATTTLAPVATPGYASQALPEAPVPVATLAGGVVIERASAGPMPLTLDEAIGRAVAHNLQALADQQNERAVSGQKLLVTNALLANLTAVAQTSTQEINLAAMGFKPASLGPLLSSFGISTGAFSTIVKVDVTSAQLNVSQYVFNVPAYELLRGAQKLTDVAGLISANDRDTIALNTGTQYLLVLADAAQLGNDRGLLRQDEEEVRRSTAREEAGVGVRLSVLRDRVQLQTEQQALIRDEAQLAKDTIQLNRLMGMPAGQQLALVDAVPYADLPAMPLAEVRQMAFANRKDLKTLDAELQVADRSRLAARFQRLPTVSFSGFYGVIGETHGLYHGDFVAQGSVKFPIFQEAEFRGESEVAAAQLSHIRNQQTALRDTIDAQLRSSMLDVQSSAELVRVAQSNVDLSAETLDDAQQRYAAGVDDDLRVVEAQAQLATAQSRLVQTLFQYNQAKLMLARQTGVVETDYRRYLGR